MKTIVILFDSLRRDCVSCYNPPQFGQSLARPVRTPHMEDFAGASTVFDSAFVNSHPTGPFRRDVWTGKIEFPHRGWGPLERDDVTFARLLGEAGVVSMFIGDNYAITDSTYGIQSSYTVANPGNVGNYQQWFTGWHLVRGHQSDRWWPSQREVSLPCSPEKMRGGAHRMQLYLQENYGRRFEEDWSVARVFRNAVNWLHENYNRDDFLLWIDSFSPHEPYDPPAYYEELYDPGYTGERVIFPNYGSTDYLSESELRHIQAMYAGTVTMADRWFGYLLDAVTAMGMLDDTMIIVTSDHGHLLGDHGMIGKPGIRQDPNGLLWHGIGDIPLIIYHPRGGKGMRESVLTGAVDLFATIMEHMGVAYPEHVDSESLLPIITGTPAGSSTNGRRELLLYARHGETVNVTDGRFTLFLHHPERHAGHTRMFDIQEDPHQNRNILGDYRARAKELKEYAGQYLRSVDATPAMRETAEQATLG